MLLVTKATSRSHPPPRRGATRDKGNLSVSPPPPQLMTCSLFDVLRTARLQDRRIPRARALRYMRELACGMHYLHSCDPPVLHRDLKVSRDERADHRHDLDGTLDLPNFTALTVPQPANLLVDAANPIKSEYGRE